MHARVVALLLALVVVLAGGWGCAQRPPPLSPEFSSVTLVVHGRFRCEGGTVYQFHGSLGWALLIHPEEGKLEVPCP